MTPISCTLAFFENLGGSEMLVVFVIVLMLFGGKKLPEFARGMGKSIREFKKAAAGVEEEFKRAIDEPENKPFVAPRSLAAAPEPAALPPPATPEEPLATEAPGESALPSPDNPLPPAPSGELDNPPPPATPGEPDKKA